MAIDALARWRLLQEITARNKSGTLTVQSGSNYQHWVLRSGCVTHVQSTTSEESLIHFLRSEKIVGEESLKRSVLLMDDRNTLGFLLVRNGSMAQNAMREAICRHRILLAASLLQSTNHLYWSDHELESKQNSLHAAAPFSQTLLQAERTFLELQPAVRSVEEFGDRFYAVRPSEAWTWLTEPERRVLEYTKTGCAFDRILRDPELDRLTCYRTVFLLWLTGHLRPHASVCSSEPARERVSLFTRIQSVPPEWIYPFLVGMLVGILAAPRPEPEMRTALSPKATERLQDMMQKPAWSSPQADSAPDPDQ